MKGDDISIPTERLEEFCRRWIAELRVFGSALREDFRPDSDLDILVRFAPDAGVDVPMISRADLITTKRAAGRARDLLDVATLEESAGDE